MATRVEKKSLLQVFLETKHDLLTEQNSNNLRQTLTQNGASLMLQHP